MTIEILHYPDDVIRDRYSILSQLGEGGNGITYAAKDLDTNDLVAIKVLSLSRLDNWKQIELFEREAKILQQLNHPGIPKYLDYFQIEKEGELTFYIIQELAPGKSLATLIDEDWQPKEETVKDIAQQILEILIYLQSLIPPVIHRDIKPQNLIYSFNKNDDFGKLFLVDFGAVQDAYHHTVMGSTVVGTYGYMAPEQFRGQAFLSTDLYSLGTTLLFLLTRQSPVELPKRKLKIQFRHLISYSEILPVGQNDTKINNLISISQDFANWIEKLIEPSLEDRFVNAEAALTVLQGKELASNLVNNKIKKPNYTSITFSNVENKVTITIPPALLCHKYNRTLAYALITYYTFWFLIILANFYSAGYYSLIYGIFYILEIALSKEFIGFARAIQAICLIGLYTLFSVQGNSSFVISCILLFGDRIILSVRRIILLKELFFTNRLEINKEVIIKKRKFFNTWLVDEIISRDESDLSIYFGSFLGKPEKKWLQQKIEQEITPTKFNREINPNLNSNRTDDW